VKLPCKHILCLKCIEELKQVSLLDCPEDKCGKKFPADFRAIVLAEKKYVLVFFCFTLQIGVNLPSSNRNCCRWIYTAVVNIMKLVVCSRDKFAF